MTSALFQPTRVYKPQPYPHPVTLTFEHERMHWHEGEIDLQDDIADWKSGKLTDKQKAFISIILKMFTQSDLNVGEFYDNFLVPKFRNSQVRGMLKSFSNREETHKRAYALVNDTLGLPESDFSAFLNIKEMMDKDEFMRDADPDTVQGLALAIFKGILNEGVNLFSSFVMLLNFQRPSAGGTMKGMGKVVEWSIKDETKHVEGLAWLLLQVIREHPHIVTDEFKKTIYLMTDHAVNLEDKFVDLAFATGGVTNITAEEVKNYIRFIADRRLTMAGMKEIYGIEKNPLSWLDIILNASDHTNFFENKVAEYETAALEGSYTYGNVFRVYGRDGCDYCVKAKNALDSFYFEYDNVDLNDIDDRQLFYSHRGFEGDSASVPKIYLLDESGNEVSLVGGYTELDQLLKRARL